ncbi:hypothetical protein EYF80_009299 [Liparis tanakae]|uniref:Uncharacterized protein n=1 Tax=Liparis tanakae TaxID=230148 RepID=A0A4Z2IRE1_9TELE|nr:hypothetical protein EYF80_009299 [Liparis tanakae]
MQQWQREEEGVSPLMVICENWVLKLWRWRWQGALTPGAAGLPARCLAAALHRVRAADSLLPAAYAVDGAVVDHAHYGHAQVTPDAEGDAEAQAAHDGDDVAAGQTEAAAVAQRGLLLRGLPGPPILRSSDVVFSTEVSDSSSASNIWPKCRNKLNKLLKLQYLQVVVEF